MCTEEFYGAFKLNPHSFNPSIWILIPLDVTKLRLHHLILHLPPKPFCSLWLTSSSCPWLRRCRPFLWQHWGHDRVPTIPRAEVLLVVHHAAPLRSKTLTPASPLCFNVYFLSCFHCYSLFSYFITQNTFLPFIAPCVCFFMFPFVLAVIFNEFFICIFFYLQHQ